jgi:hypothetical protein
MSGCADIFLSLPKTNRETEELLNSSNLSEVNMKLATLINDVSFEIPS